MIFIDTLLGRLSLSLLPQPQLIFRGLMLNEPRHNSSLSAQNTRDTQYDLLCVTYR